MTAPVAEVASGIEVPTHRRFTLAPAALAAVDLPTPFLAGDLGVLAARVDRFRAALPGIKPFYAVKCNPTPQVLATIAAAGASFEIASIGELRVLQELGVRPRDVLYSNTVKPAAHVAAAAAAGVWRFAVDSEGELHKIAAHAPGSAVYVRLRVDDTDSVFPLSGKFGTGAVQARSLLGQARRLGLQPYGLTFHVGSQCVVPTAWTRALASVGRLMHQLEEDGIRLGMVDIGGGFPADYGDPVPPIEVIGRAISAALAHLPYRPALLAAEPGRHLVAETAVMVTEVIGRAERSGEEWLHVDVSAFHGFMETQQTAGGWRYPLWTSRPDHGSVATSRFTVTGPTCDSGDTMFRGAVLPHTMAEGDRLYIGAAGAYTLSYASHFNGFPPPSAHFFAN
jgi:ornithine decarboxylase